MSKLIVAILIATAPIFLIASASQTPSSITIER